MYECEDHRNINDLNNMLRIIGEADDRRQGINNNLLNTAKFKMPKTILFRLIIIREQKGQVSKVLLDGLYDPDCPLSMLRGVRTDVFGEIIWKEMLAWDWQFFP